MTSEYQRAFTGDTFSGDVEGGAVVNRNAHHRQAGGDVDAVVAIDSLGGNISEYAAKPTANATAAPGPEAKCPTASA